MKLGRHELIKRNYFFSFLTPRETFSGETLHFPVKLYISRRNSTFSGETLHFPVKLYIFRWNSTFSGKTTMRENGSWYLIYCEPVEAEKTLERCQNIITSFLPLVLNCKRCLSLNCPNVTPRRPRMSASDWVLLPGYLLSRLSCWLCLKCLPE